MRPCYFRRTGAHITWIGACGLATRCAKEQDGVAAARGVLSHELNTRSRPSSPCPLAPKPGNRSRTERFLGLRRGPEGLSLISRAEASKSSCDSHAAQLRA